MTTIPATSTVPEATATAPPLAKPLSRLLAYGIDSILLFVVAVFVAALFTSTRTVNYPDGETVEQTTTAAFVLPLLMLLWTGYFVASWSAFGQTIGMRAVGIAVWRVDRTRLAPSAALGRVIVLSLGISLFGIGVLSILGDRFGQGWHDRVAGTIVVEERP